MAARFIAISQSRAMLSRAGEAPRGRARPCGCSRYLLLGCSRYLLLGFSAGLPDHMFSTVLSARLAKHGASWY